jgi:D-beta-D-heptose 7-phosphate kinase/D-beta-D-heptose 1-phosphate adenosyltransferase
MSDPEADDLILVLGDVMLDRNILGRIERISPEAPAPVVLVERETLQLGGAGNVAHNVRCLGHPVRLIGVRGDDTEGALLVQLASERGVETRLIVAEDRPTTTKSRIFAGRGQQVLRLDREIVTPLPRHVERQVKRLLDDGLGAARALIISDYAKGTVTDGLLGWLLRRAARRGMPSVVDPKRRDFQGYRGASVITPNVSEAARALGLDRLLAADDAVEQAAEQLRQVSGAGAVLLTRGERGMLLRTSDATVVLRAQARAVSDVTGAGDTVAAMLAVALAEGLSLREAAERANLAAGLAVEKVGTQPVGRAELDQRLLGCRSAYKVMDRRAAQECVERWRQQGKTIVFTNGCFDLLHAGHIHCLEEARRQGDYLVVGLNSDRSVRVLKGEGRPVVAEAERAAVLAALGCVDVVVLFDEDHPAALVDLLRPHVLVKGGDYCPEQIAGAQRVLADGGRVVIVPLLPGLSTTQLLQRADTDAPRTSHPGR